MIVSADAIRTVAVLGAGTMGRGIAHVAALAGHAVAMHDIDEAAAGRGLEAIRQSLAKGVELGKLAPEARDAALARIRVTTDLAGACAGADAVVEAAPEILALKQRIFRDVEAAAPAHALLATNTSSLSIGELAGVLSESGRGRVVGMHFFNPVHLMKLVEVVRHAAADPAAVACAVAFAERLGKTPITVEDAPGFASSRLGIAIGLEAMRMVEQGVASAADIDTAMKLGYGHPMGPLELTDLVGLDVRLAIAEYLASQLGPGFTPPDILRAKVAAGELGKKSGAGFYRWIDGKRA
jgi:3-hydroxybutyryl-CoA dehydrogenase